MLSPWTVTTKALFKYLLITKLSKMSVNNSLKLFIGLSLTLLVMVSCNKEQQLQENDSFQIEYITFNYPQLDDEGRLTFNTPSDITDMINGMDVLRMSEIKQLHEENGFISEYMNRYSENPETSKINYNAGFIEDELFASIINVNGELRFDNNIIYKVGADYSFLFKNGEEELVDRFYRELAGGTITVEPMVENKFYEELIVFKTHQESSESSNSRNIIDRFFNDDHRLRGKTTSAWAGVYASIRAVTKADERRNFLFWTNWRNEDIQNISVTGNAEIWVNGGRQLPAPVAFNVNRINDNVARRILWQASGTITLGGWCGFFVCPGPAPMPPRVEGTATHAGTRDGVGLNLTTDW